jgi:GTP-binding protein YchF
MSLKVGLVGLPNVGKSTLFKALSRRADVSAENFPFCTIEPNIALVPFWDERLKALCETIKSAKIIPDFVTFVDIAGLIEGAHKGKGFGNSFLSHIREVDLVIHVIRCFEDDTIIHEYETVNSLRDFSVIEMELLLEDMAYLEKKLSKKSKDEEKIKKILEKAFQFIKNKELPLRQGEWTSEEYVFLKKQGLLTLKPILCVANIHENDLCADIDSIQNPHFQNLKKTLSASSIPVIPLASEFECQCAFLNEEAQKEMLSLSGLLKSGLHELTQCAHQHLGLINFFTVGPKETRAWSIALGSFAPQAAGVIHSDFEHHFIRAEQVFWKEFVAYKGWSGLKIEGKMNIRGKDYEVKDGDVLNFLTSA